MYRLRQDIYYRLLNLYIGYKTYPHDKWNAEKKL